MPSVNISAPVRGSNCTQSTVACQGTYNTIDLEVAMAREAPMAEVEGGGGTTVQVTLTGPSTYGPSDAALSTVDGTSTWSYTFTNVATGTYSLKAVLTVGGTSGDVKSNVSGIAVSSGNSGGGGGTV